MGNSAVRWSLKTCYLLMKTRTPCEPLIFKMQCNTSSISTVSYSVLLFTIKVVTTSIGLPIKACPLAFENVPKVKRHIVMCDITVTRWLDYLFNIWPFTSMKIAKSYIFNQSRFNALLDIK